MAITDVLLGRPLATSEEQGEHIGVAAGIPIFGLDALTSAAYGPEAALAILIPLGVYGTQYIVPIIVSILTLLVIVYFSYRQTILEYPNGGGSYTVASENLGDNAGLLAAAALMIDYILTAAVGISAGVSALTAAVPVLLPHTLELCLLILAILAVVNLRGVKESGTAFFIPTFLFIGTLLTLIGVGVYKTVVSDFHPVSVAVLPVPHGPHSHLVGFAFAWLIVKAFSSGCAAMTGVEAVSNGVTAFGEPRAKRANMTLTVIIAILIVLLFGIAWLTKHYAIMAMDPYADGYQTLLSLLVTAVFGRGWFYYLTMASILAALSLSANTAFAGFPRLARTIALRDYLPHVFILRGRRLLFSHGIYALTGFTAVILILFRGVTDGLIPLYAIGAFLAFTLSQAGMVVHWKKQTGSHASHKWHMLVNGVGAVATGVTTLVVLASKFLAGAWVTALLIPTLILLMMAVKRHYSRVRVEMHDMTPLNVTHLEQPLVVIPMARWDRIGEKALRFGLVMSKDVKVVHIDCDEGEESLCTIWDANVLQPLRAADMAEPVLVELRSGYRQFITPLITYVLELEQANPTRKVAVLLPELVVKHWWENLLHNQRVQLLKLVLLLKGKQRIVVVNIPWYL